MHGLPGCQADRPIAAYVQGAWTPAVPAPAGQAGGILMLHVLQLLLGAVTLQGCQGTCM